MANQNSNGDFPFRTDLAMERRRSDPDLPGTMYLEENEGVFTMTRLTITDEESEEVIGQPMGQYITVSFPGIRFLGNADRNALSRVLTRELSALICSSTGAKPSPKTRVVIVGLGNAAITSDALGPEVLRRLQATGHLRSLEPSLFRSLGCAEVYTVTPGVLSQTGIESADLLSEVCHTLSPSLVIAIDALAARSVSRLASTVQLSDTGVRPGSGIGNHRGAIDRASLGIPVLSIGVPTVVEAMTLVADTLSSLGQDEEYLPDDGKRDLFYVTPKDIDESISLLASVIADVLTALFALPE